MTDETKLDKDDAEIIKILSELRSRHNFFDEADEPYYRALSTAIKKLSEQADGDTISRQAALDCFHGWVDWHGNVHSADEMAEYKAIEQLPSAEPKRGKWEITNLGAVGAFDSCSECKRVVKHKAPFYNYCPNCGADMRGEKDV